MTEKELTVDLKMLPDGYQRRDLPLQNGKVYKFSRGGVPFYAQLSRITGPGITPEADGFVLRRGGGRTTKVEALDDFIIEDVSKEISDQVLQAIQNTEGSDASKWMG